MHSRLVRRSIAGLVLLVFALGLASAAAGWRRRELVQWWLLRELAQRGVAPAQLEVASVDSHRLELRGLRAGAGDALAIAAIDADYTLQGLWRGRVRSLRVSGVRLTGTLGPVGRSFGGIAALEGRRDRADPTAPGASPSALRLPALPSSELRIEDARAELATPQGPLHVELSLTAEEADGQLRARGDFSAAHALANARAVLDLAGAADAASGGVALGLDLAPGADLSLPLSAGKLAQSARIVIAGPEIDVTLQPGPFSLAFGRGKDALRLEGSTPESKLRTRIGDDGRLAPLALTASGGELRAPGLGIAARGFDIDVTLDARTRALAGNVGVRELRDTRKPRRAPDFSLAGRVEPRGAALAFELHATEAKQRAVIHAQGSFDPETRRGDLRLRSEPLLFAPGGLQPEQLAPGIAGWLQSVVGTLEANGRLRFGGAPARLTLDVAARELGFATKLAQVEGLNGALRFEGPSPYSTPSGQLVSIARIGFGLDLTNGVIAGGLRPGGVVVVEQAEWQVLGGRVHTAGRIDPQVPQQAFVLEAEALDLAQLLALIELEGLSGEGTIDGRLPIERRPDAIRIDHGLFRARPGGRLRYRPTGAAANLRKSQPGFELLLGALDDMQLEQLELELNGDANGVMQLGLRLAGVNPEFQDGRPVHYNLNVESRLADLVRQSAAVSKIPQEIEERLQQFQRSAP